jgi:hypothetical protein
MMRTFTILTVVISVSAQAQLAHGGAPFGWGAPASHFDPVPTTTLAPIAPVDSPATLASGTLGGFHFGEQRMVPVDILAYGVWADMPDGGRVCRYSVVSPGAAMVSVQFDVFQLPVGGKVFLYDPARTVFLGAFTHANEQPSGGLATALLPGDAVTIEYQAPPGTASAHLHVASLTHAWLNIFDHRSSGQRSLHPGWQCSPCQTNMACPVAADWHDQDRSVVWFMGPNGDGCNGTLLNNTAQDGTPYLLIAHHCYQPSPSEWVFYFNYESLTCDGDSGESYQTLTGALLRAETYGGDFDLMELNDTPPDNFNVYYAGWDHGGSVPQSGASIYNPLACVKKIAFFDSPATTDTVVETNTLCWKTYWNGGILEPGASGAPLFDQNKRLIGHMVDGEQTCDSATTQPTFASKFSENWDGPTSATRLRDWLDPADTAMTLDGFDPGMAPVPTVRVRLKALLQGPYMSGTGMMNATLNDGGMVPLTEPYTALGYSFIGGSAGASTAQAILDITGPDEVVDWVVVELRDKNDPASVLASRPALIRRDGSIVDMDGISDVTFTDQPADQYYVAVRHRNHLGIITATAHSLSGTATLMDLTNGSTPLLGGGPATVDVGGVRCMWSGDVNMDGMVRYTGSQNDRESILFLIGGIDPTNTATGYFQEDLNMDGSVKYTGVDNDRDALLLNVGALPTGQLDGTIP